MPTQARYYSSTAAKTTLAASISSSAVSLTLAAASNLPSQYPYTLILEKDTGNEEVVEVTGLVGSAYQITRNIDSSGAKPHAFGANVEHGVSARDFNESRQHEVATSGHHGVTGDIVGTGGAQTLTSKTLTSPAINGGTITTATYAGGTLSGAFTSTATITGGTITGATITGVSSAGMVDSSAAPKNYVDNILGSATAASTSAASAATSASSAATSASSAATSRSSALTSQTSAATSATSAATSASSALTSQTSAATSASSASVSASAASTSASSASTSASSAATSAAAAVVSASSAATSSSSAAASATTATNSAASATTSAASAATSASSAATSATSAAASATAAATSATSSAASATTALNSAATATTSASQAATSASSAATSATAAATSASSASTSATSAATSASSASTSASSAAASATSAAGYVVPSQTGNAGKFLGTDGTAVSWTNTVTVTSGTTVPLTIQNNGTGNSFVVNDEASDATPFVIDAAGNTGIGNSAPTYKLDVSSTARVGGSTTNTGTGLVVNGQTFLNSSVNWNYGNLEITRNAANTSTPRFIGLNLDGDSKTDTTIGATNSIWGIYDSSPTTGSLSSTLNAVMAYGAYAGHRWYTNGTERMRIATTGIVGIGTTPSGAMLHVVNNTAGNIGTIIKGAASQTGDLLQVQDSAATILARFNSSGQLGIGGLPGSPIDVINSGANNVNVRVRNSAGITDLYTLASGDGHLVNQTTGKALTFGTQGTERMRIDSSGNVGIGTVSPTNRLTVNGAIDFTGSAFSGSGTGIWQQATNVLAFVTAGSNRLAIDATGKVGIGTTSPTATLDVIGSIKSDNLSGRNKIINGAFDIWQRGITFAGGQYGADRFNSGAGSNAFTITQTSGIGGSRYAAKLTQTGSNSFTQFGTQIEFNNCYDLQNQTVTISFVAQANNTNSGSTGFIARTRTIAGIDGACLFTGSNADTSITLTTTATRYTVTRALPATFGSLSLEFCTNAGVTGDGYTISNIQLELGSAATPFNRAGGTIQGELAACQRYYYRTSSATNSNPAYSLFCTGFASSTTQILATVNFPVSMRIAPSALDTSAMSTFYSEGGNTWNTPTSISIGGSIQNNLGQIVIVKSGFTSGANYLIFSNNTTTAFLGFTAEL